MSRRSRKRAQQSQGDQQSADDAGEQKDIETGEGAGDDAGDEGGADESMEHAADEADEADDASDDESGDEADDDGQDDGDQGDSDDETDDQGGDGDGDGDDVVADGETEEEVVAAAPEHGTMEAADAHIADLPDHPDGSGGKILNRPFSTGGANG